MSEGRFRKIVAAYDGSPDSEKAINMGVFLSDKFGSELVIVHVVSMPTITYSGAAGAAIPNYSDLELAMREGAKRTIAKGIEVAKGQGGNPRGEILEGPSTVQALVEFAATENADLIVVGTRGISAFKKLLMGSTSTGLVTHAHCPVLVVR